MGRKKDAPRDRFMDFRFARTIPHMTVSWISGLRVRSHTWISGDAGGGQPGAGDGEAGDGGGQPPDGGAPVPGGGGGGLHLEVG